MVRRITSALYSSKCKGLSKVIKASAFSTFNIQLKAYSNSGNVLTPKCRRNKGLTPMVRWKSSKTLDRQFRLLLLGVLLRNTELTLLLKILVDIELERVIFRAIRICHHRSCPLSITRPSAGSQEYEPWSIIHEPVSTCKYNLYWLTMNNEIDHKVVRLPRRSRVRNKIFDHPINIGDDKVVSSLWRVYRLVIDKTFHVSIKSSHVPT